MKAVRIHQFGGSEQVRIEELPKPAPEPGRAVVRIRAAAVNPVDWMIRERIYNPEGADKTPLTLGQDFSGVVEQIGPAETRLRAGDEVFGETWGSFAEYASVPVSDLVPKPKGVDFVTAASIPMAALTAWQATIDVAQAAREMRFLIHGATGGVGSFAAQFAKWRGAEVIATASQAGVEYLRSIGVDRIIDYTRERFEDLVRDVDVVLDPLGGDTQARSWAVLKRGGMLINLVGEIDEAAAQKAGARGVLFGMEYKTGDLEQIAALVSQGAVTPHVSEVLPFEQAREALDLNQAGKSHGKIVLRVS